jgi:hypothetical protein
MSIKSFSAKGLPQSEDLAKAIQAVREDGVVVLTDAVDMEHIETLKERWLADTELLLKREDKPFNWVSGNLQQNPPPFEPYLFRDILVNDAVIAVSLGILGRHMKCAFYSGNTALPSEARQPVHADVGQLWPNQTVAHPAYALVVNIPLVDVSAENGSTEIWPGTHLDTSIVMQDGDIKVAKEVYEARRKVCPELQPNIKAGSIVIRDIRMWHAGMPNHTKTPRPMIGMIHYVGWWWTAPLPFPKGTEKYFEHPDLRWHNEYTDEPIDHISAPGSYEYAGK